MNTILKLENRIIAALLAVVLLLTLFTGLRIQVQAEEPGALEKSTLTFHVKMTAEMVPDESATGRVAGEAINGTAKAYWDNASPDNSVVFIEDGEDVPEEYTPVTSSDVATFALEHCVIKDGTVYQQLFVTDAASIGTSQAGEYDSTEQVYWVFNWMTGTDSDYSSHLIAKDGYLYHQKRADGIADGTAVDGGYAYAYFVYSKNYSATVDDSLLGEAAPAVAVVAVDETGTTLNYQEIDFVLNIKESDFDLGRAVSVPDDSANEKKEVITIEIAGDFEVQGDDPFYANLESKATIKGPSTQYGTLNYSVDGNDIAVSYDEGSLSWNVESKKVLSEDTTKAIIANIKIGDKIYASKKVCDFAIKAPTKTELSVKDTKVNKKGFTQTTGEWDIMYAFKGTGISQSMIDLKSGGSIKGYAADPETPGAFIVTVSYAGESELTNGETYTVGVEGFSNISAAFTVDATAPTVEILSEDYYITSDDRTYLYPSSGVIAKGENDGNDTLENGESYSVAFQVKVKDKFFDDAWYAAYQGSLQGANPGASIDFIEENKAFKITCTQEAGKTFAYPFELPKIEDYAGNVFEPKQDEEGYYLELKDDKIPCTYEEQKTKITVYLDSQSPIGLTEPLIQFYQNDGITPIPDDKPYNGGDITTPSLFAEISLTDNTNGSGINEIEFNHDNSIYGEMDNPTYPTLDENNKASEQYHLQPGVEENAIPFSVKVTDKVGNHRTFFSLFDYDNLAPRINTETTPDPLNPANQIKDEDAGTVYNYYKNNLTYSFTVVDLNLEDLVLTYKVLDKKTGRTTPYSAKATNLSAAEDGEVSSLGKASEADVLANATVTLSSDSEGVRTATVGFEIDVANKEGELLEYELTASDTAGNPVSSVKGPESIELAGKTYEQKVIFDTVAPKVKVTRTGVADPIPMEGGKTEHHNKNITFTVEVKDSYLDVRDGKSVINITGWDSDTPESPYVGTLTLSAEDDINYSGTTEKIGYDEKKKDELYEFVVNGIEGTIVDLAGNTAEKYDEEADQGNFDSHININNNDGALSFEKGYSIVVDKNDPVIIINGAEEADNKDKSNTIYYFKGPDKEEPDKEEPDKAKIYVTIRDIHLNTDTAATYVTYVITEDGESTEHSAEGISAVSEKKGVFTLEISITDGEMLTNLSVTAKDYAENESINNDRKALTYIVDATKPVVDVKITAHQKESTEDSIEKFFVNGDKLHVKFKNTAVAESGKMAKDKGIMPQEVSFVVTVTDRNIEFDKTKGYSSEYYYATAEFKKNNGKWTGDRLLNESSTIKYAAKTITVDPDSSNEYIFDLGIYDLAGNTPDFESVQKMFKENIGFYDPDAITISDDKIKGELVVDRHRPASEDTDTLPPEIILSTAEDYQADLGNNVLLYNHNKEYTLNVYDPKYKDQEGTDVWAGIESIDWEVNSIATTSEGKKEYHVDGNHQQAVTDIKIPVDIEENTEANDIVLKVTVTDQAGNKTYFNQPLAIDRQAPRVQVIYDNNSVSHNKYFKADRELTVTIKDLNFDLSKTSLTTQPSIAAGFDEASHTYTAKVKYNVDGDYTFAMETTDRATNQGYVDYTNGGTNAAPQEFTIDKTAPIINVTFDNNNVRNGKYYNANRVANVNIIEHNFLAAEVQAPVTANLDGAPIAAPGISGFSRAGDSNNAQIPFVNDGDYSFTVDYMDMAGNPAQQVVIPEFTIDKTVPYAVIGNVENRHAYPGEIRPTVTFTDINFDPNGNKITWILRKKGTDEVLETRLAGTEASIGHGAMFTFNDLPYDRENDGIYFLSAVITDLAGNSYTTETVTYSVNRFGSVYEAVNNETKKVADHGIIKIAPKLVVREINPNKVHNQSVTVAVNGTTKTLKEGEDYKIGKSEQEDEWKVYTYTIEDSVFTDKNNKKPIQGTNVVTLYSEDEAANKNSNRTNVEGNKLDIEFLIDTEAPTGYITVQGLAEGKKRIQRSKTTATTAWEDNSIVGKVEIYLNDEKVETLEGKDLEKANGKYSITVDQKTYVQSVYAVITDVAGNTRDIDEVNFFLNASGFQQLLHNTGLLIAVIAGIAAIAAAIIAIIVNRKKKARNDQG